MRLFSLVFLTIFLLLPVSANIVKLNGTGHAMTKALTLDDAINSAGIIFKGEFRDSKIVTEGKTNVRLLKFKVIEPLRGVSGKEIIIKEWAQVASPFTTKEVEEGKPYVFMFYAPSAKGLSSLIGEEQGYIDLGDDDETPKFAKRMLNYEKRSYSGISGLARSIKSLGRKTPKASEIKSYTDLRGVLSK